MYMNADIYIYLLIHVVIRYSPICDFYQVLVFNMKCWIWTTNKRPMGL